MSQYKKPTLDQFTKIAIATGGNKTDMAKRLNCDRRSIQRWVAEDAEFAEVIEDVIESLMDIVESNIRRLVTGIALVDGKGKQIGWQERPSETLLIFTAKTKGKDRGYVERQELTGKNGKDLIPSRPFLIVDPEQPNQIEELDIGADIPT